MDLHIEQRRGGLVETVHPVSVRVIERGEVGFAAGPDVASFWRSACKPWQLATSLLHLPDDLVDALPARDLSIGAASHSGQAVHVERVRALLGRFGLTEDGLRCGAHPPMHEESARRLWREGGTPGNVHNNCSGKHTFMLAASVREGWAADYRPADHPLQAENLARLTRWMGYAPLAAVDGCGVPTFHAPLSAMARAWAGLAAAMAGDAGEPERTARSSAAFERATLFASGDGGGRDGAACRPGTDDNGASDAEKRRDEPGARARIGEPDRTARSSAAFERATLFASGDGGGRDGAACRPGTDDNGASDAEKRRDEPGARARIGEAREAAILGRIGWAMHAEPELMSGEGRLDLAVVRASRVPLTVKVGAEGLFCIAVPSLARGIAVKVHTGNGEALAVAVRAVLDRLLPGAIEVPAGGEWPGERVVNVVGAPVGERVAVWGPVR